MNIYLCLFHVLKIQFADEHKVGLKGNIVIPISVLLLLSGLSLAFIGANTFLEVNQDCDGPTIFVGVDVGYGNETDVYKTADAVEGYANLIVIGSLDVTEDTEALIRVCDYLYQKSFYFMIYVGFATNGSFPPRGPDPSFFNVTAQQWGNQFIGAYMFDEAGGQQIDQNHPILENADNYTQASQIYVNHLSNALTNYNCYYSSPDLRLFTSDYALYWYDYLSGYDVILTQYVGNQSRQVSNSLCRGAAHSENKEWGVIITWKYNQAPFLEEANQLYEDMVLAYENQAKYIVVFNSPENNTHPTSLGTLTDGHLEAMEQFWNYTKTNPQSESYIANTAYVLPTGYGYGFRSAYDKIWGLWEADVLSSQVWTDTNSLIETYGNFLDVIYEDALNQHSAALQYRRLIFWNGTVIQR